MRIGRRQLLQSGLALPLLAVQRPPPGVDWNTWFHDWLKRDFGMVGYYADDNARLLASRAPVEVVFMGDSITEGWMDKSPAFFTPGRIDRGIGGQTTPQMVLRMIPDVVDLKPKAVHIMGGTNDIAGNTGPMTPQMTEDDIRAMIDIAQRHAIEVLLASIPPAGKFPWAPQIETPGAISALNIRLRNLARESGATWVDYHRVLDDGTGTMKPGLSSDGVHPTAAGYEAMARVIEPLLRRMLARPARS
jgi:lysophospholipase L1-like esterase